MEADDEVRSQVRSEVFSMAAPSIGAATDLMRAAGPTRHEEKKAKKNRGEDNDSVAARDEVLREGGDIAEEYSKSGRGKGKSLSTKAEPWTPTDGDGQGPGEGFEDGAYSEEEGEGGEHYEDGTLPPHACTYCGIYNSSCVVRCVRTNKWFCNGRGGSSGSHALQHLIRSKNKEVALHPDSPLGDATLECYNCGCRNCFLLGFIPSKTQTGVVVLLCREPCLNLEALKDQGWDLSLWQPIVEDKAFLPWLVHVPTKEEEEKARPVTVSQIAGIETLWRKRPDATWEQYLELAAKGTNFDDLAPEGGAGDGSGGANAAALPAANPVLLRYDDGYEYQNIYGPLVKLESDESKLMSQALRQDGVSLRWETQIPGGGAASAATAASAGSGSSGSGTQKRVFAHFRFNRPDSELMKLIVGDEMKIKLPSLATQLGLTALLDKATKKAASNSNVGGGGYAGPEAEAEKDGDGEKEEDDDDDAAWWGIGSIKSVVDGEICIELTSHSGTGETTTATSPEAKAAAAKALKDAVQSAVQVKGGKGGKHGNKGPVTAGGGGGGQSFLQGIPFGTTSGFIVELVWKSVTFDRMQTALRTFAVDDRSVSAYLYHALLGHAVEPTVLPVSLPAEIRAPGLPALNASQETAVRTVLQRPLSLIQVSRLICVALEASLPRSCCSLCLCHLPRFFLPASSLPAGPSRYWQDCYLSDNRLLPSAASQDQRAAVIPLVTSRPQGW
jgi:RNA helicase (UPF2 interacting domain)